MAAENKPGSIPIPVGLLAKDLDKGADVIKDRDWYNDRSVAVALALLDLLQNYPPRLLHKAIQRRQGFVEEPVTLEDPDF
ncbi:hypothetical protein DKX38_019994 [Salix brachista]|uniref:Uncharacterized protein n=1 Tax=Salix brachista TaxID=2182728 RepID=A0A5N5KHR2_9ROSI|nr:hypothetical protein DKX38_019994 [Salix brachista]